MIHFTIFCVLCLFICKIVINAAILSHFEGSLVPVGNYCKKALIDLNMMQHVNQNRSEKLSDRRHLRLEHMLVFLCGGSVSSLSATTRLGLGLLSDPSGVSLAEVPAPACTTNTDIHSNQRW